MESHLYITYGEVTAKIIVGYRFIDAHRLKMKVIARDRIKRCI